MSVRRSAGVGWTQVTLLESSEEEPVNRTGRPGGRVRDLRRLDLAHRLPGPVRLSAGLQIEHPSQPPSPGNRLVGPGRAHADPCGEVLDGFAVQPPGRRHQDRLAEQHLYQTA